MLRSTKKKNAGRRLFRPLARKYAAVFLWLLLAWCVTGVWFVHHPRPWLLAHQVSWPRFCTVPLLWIGEPLEDVLNGLGLLGEDAVLTTNRSAPVDAVFFAGAPVRRAAPAPNDITILDRGEFKVGWSPRLRHPVWVAYHVPATARFEVGKRPNFKRDASLPESPTAADYTRSGYDRGHMAPNYAIATRFGPDDQARTFLMSNIAPQTPSLNRGVWRNIEHRIAEFWTARWGEIWVIVGCLSDGNETLSGTSIDIPSHFYQVIVAQNGKEVRALAVLIEQRVPWRAWPTRYLVTIDELEELTGFDFLPELDDKEEAALEAQLPSRLWPVRLRDIIHQIALRRPPSY